MRIGSGSFRGRNIKAPPGRKTRPTSGRLKKSLFDILAPRLALARVLDLFAGAGALGFEALSRGAAWVTFVEKGKAAARTIEDNLVSLGMEEQGEVLRREVSPALTFLAARDDIFHFIFLDPPYRSDKSTSVLKRIANSPLLAPDGMVILEHHHKTQPEDGCGNLKIQRQVRSGESCLTFFAFQGETG